MKLKVTKRAKENFHAIRGYIEGNWGSKSADEFQTKIENFLDLLQDFPEIGTLEVKEKGIRGFTITKQTTIFYRIKGETIIILAFFDNRQDSDRKPE
jgi:plasmid stabilization system protein ParE